MIMYGNSVGKIAFDSLHYRHSAMFYGKTKNFNGRFDKFIFSATVKKYYISLILVRKTSICSDNEKK
jgi:hypothetical protein